MDLRSLTIFAAVASHRSFTKAAIALDFSQSHVTTQVQKLERHVGAKLFHRRGRGIELTERGSILLSYARRMIGLAHEAEEAVGARSNAPLTIAAHESLTIYKLPELLARLRKVSPETSVRIASIEEDRLSRAALDGLIDLAFVYTTESNPGVNAVAIGEEHPVVVCSGQLPMSSTHRLSASDIRQFEGLVTATPCPTRTNYDAMLAGLGIGDARLRELPSIEAIKRCALHGLGYAVLPRTSVSGEIARRALFELEPPAEIENIFATLVIAPGKTTELNAFIEATRAVFR